MYVEVHDSGPGLSEEASRSLFEPTISFKKRGMGLGLSIARKSALLTGGDISLVPRRAGRRRVSRRSARTRRSESWRRKRILIVDDEENIGRRCA